MFRLRFCLPGHGSVSLKTEDIFAAEVQILQMESLLSRCPRQNVCRSLCGTDTHRDHLHKVFPAFFIPVDKKQIISPVTHRFNIFPAKSAVFFFKRADADHAVGIHLLIFCMFGLPDQPSFLRQPPGGCFLFFT